MAVAGVPTGYLLSRFTRKTVLQFGIVIFSAGTALTAVSAVSPTCSPIARPPVSVRPCNSPP